MIEGHQIADLLEGIMQEAKATTNLEALGNEYQQVLEYREQIKMNNILHHFISSMPPRFKIDCKEYIEAFEESEINYRSHHYIYPVGVTTIERQSR